MNKEEQDLQQKVLRNPFYFEHFSSCGREISGKCMQASTKYLSLKICIF